MGRESEIAWTDATFNPWIGCAHKSDGCRFCYAEQLVAVRWKRVEWGVKALRVHTSPAYWKQPIAWNAKAAEAGVRLRVFCASLADVFDEHPDVAPWRAELWALIRSTPNLDWLLLTKRPENVLAGDGMLPGDWNYGYPNVWLGTTVEDQRVIARIDVLRAVPAALRFLSVEPMIGLVDLEGRLEGIHWVIVGGESGHGARPMLLPWAVNVIGDSIRAGAAVFVKQLGAVASAELRDGEHRRDPKGGDIARFPAGFAIREFPRSAVIA
jgi:protein gp37